MTEISQILLILLDSRCPTLHFPPALVSFLASAAPPDRVRPILVLTKVDIAGPARADAWTRYLRARHPGLRIVHVESYVEKTFGPDATAEARKRALEPQLPSAFREALVDALREAHAELLQPPEEVRADARRLAKWKPRVKASVDWDAVLKAQGGKVGTAVGPGGHARKHSKAALDEHPAHADVGEEGHREDERPEEEGEPDVLTIGVIGAPIAASSSS